MNQSTGWVEHSLGRPWHDWTFWTYPERLILAAAPGFPSEFRLARPNNLSGAGRYPLIVRPLLKSTNWSVQWNITMYWSDFTPI